MNAKLSSLNLKSNRSRRWASKRDRFAYSNTCAIMGFAWIRVNDRFVRRYPADVAG
jgi:hypothetical protein